MEIISRQEAMERGLSRYFTGKPCKHGHVSLRIASNRRCEECYRAHEKSSSRRGNRKARYAANKELSNKQSREYRENNREAVRKRDREYKKENAAYYAELAANRKSSKLNATPDWLTPEHLEQIKSLYEESSKQPTPHHVDHIVPLQGETVCGLHVPWNLQVIPAEQNLRKGASHSG